MNNHDDQFLDELKGLKVMNSINQDKKEEMRLNIAKYAEKKRARQKRKRQFVWISTAAAVVLFGVIVMSIMNQQTETVDDPDPTPPTEEQPVQGEDPDSDTIEEPENNSEEEQPEFNVEVEGPFDDTIMPEGMEESTQVMEFQITSHQISYRMDQLLGNYNISENKVTHSTDIDFGTVIVEVVNDTDLNDFAKELDGDQTPLDSEENPFEGIQSHQSGEQVTGYYAYQIKDDVLYIQYEYGIEGGDGFGTRLKLLRESINVME